MNQPLPFVNFTDAAVAHIASIVKKEKGKIFRLSLKKTGCSGYAYLPQVIDAPVSLEDIPLILANGLTVYIDHQFKNFIKGLSVDYLSEKLGGIKQSRLVFVNPNEKNHCGCGESFTIEEKT